MPARRELTMRQLRQSRSPTPFSSSASSRGPGYGPAYAGGSGLGLAGARGEAAGRQSNIRFKRVDAAFVRLQRRRNEKRPILPPTSQTIEVGSTQRAMKV
ncbi:hypothetical protein SAMN05519103_09390 [Rhizobiales bacterium GAS113]|nr:hypothetical protein SAMN05519103_09390 [Rhizobiales bacterium GAS113]